MKRVFKLAIIGLLSFLAVYIVWLNRPRPALETKFVQEVSKDAVNEEVTNELTAEQDTSLNDASNVDIVTPGQYALVNDTKQIYQTFNNCGPATLSMIMSFYGKNVSQKELAEQMRPYQVANGDNDDKTIFTYEFVDWAKQYGFEAVGRVDGNIDLLKKFTANEIPVVVKTWLHVNDDIGHFRIVRGFDDRKQVIIQDDSYEGPNKKFAYYDFLSMWQPFNYAYIVVYKPDQRDLVKAIIGQEINEKIAWRNSIDRAEKESQLDSKNVYPVFNMATAYYHLDDYQKSVSAFEKVEDRLPKRMLWYQIEPILAYQKLGSYARVLSMTDNILNNGNRAFSELYQIRGEIYLAQGDRDKAKSEFEQAVKYNQNYQPAIKALEAL